MKSWLKKIFSFLEPQEKPKKKSISLVKPRPISFQERYHQIENAQKIAVFFERFNAELKTAIKQISPRKTIFIEQGRFQDGTRFMYYKPFNQKGLILETTSEGWTISRAEKIPTQEMFLKNTTDLWDHVKLLDAQDSSVVRVSSSQNKNELPVFSVYSSQTIADLIKNMSAADE